MDELTKEQIHIMNHALGGLKFPSIWKNKTILNKCYRNRYITYSIDESWEDLIKKGFAGKEINNNSDGSKFYWYYVTELGIANLRRFV